LQRCLRLRPEKRESILRLIRQSCFRFVSAHASNYLKNEIEHKSKLEYRSIINCHSILSTPEMALSE